MKQLVQLKVEATAELLDPHAAQFRNLHMDDFTLCGEMNTKNALGGYVGFDRFYSDGKARFRSAAIRLDNRSRENGIVIKNGSLADGFDEIGMLACAMGRMLDSTAATAITLTLAM